MLTLLETPSLKQRLGEYCLRLTDFSPWRKSLGLCGAWCVVLPWENGSSCLFTLADLKVKRAGIICSDEANFGVDRL
jgi:hypothetical protein